MNINKIRVQVLALLGLTLLGQYAAACDERTGKNCLSISWSNNPDEIKKREQEEQQQREEIRREQQLIDEELIRRGWPKSREHELRKFFAVKKAAAAVRPQPYTKATRLDPATTSVNIQSKWLNKQLEDQNNTFERTEPNNLTQNKDKQVKRQAFNEAILVCTKPDVSGHFQCKTPVDVISGNPVDKNWATPEALVSWASSSCPDARKLPSETHLVWGCGFAATNNSNSMDRSSGVDVKGRNIYYCTPKETSCRRTEP